MRLPDWAKKRYQDNVHVYIVLITMLTITMTLICDCIFETCS